MVLFFKEMAKDTFRVSVRSKGRGQRGGHRRVLRRRRSRPRRRVHGVGPYACLIEDIPRKIEELFRRKAGPARTAKAGCPGGSMDGLILVDKPRGATSHDIVARVRRILGEQRVGHFGTLDPLATGLLLVAVGSATQLFPLFSKHDKVYCGRDAAWAVATDTYDSQGRPTASGRPRRSRTGTALVEAMKGIRRRIQQVPPPYSAKKVAGKPLYKWARAKRPMTSPPRPVIVYAFKLSISGLPVVDFEVHCGSGTYVRSLVHDSGPGPRLRRPSGRPPAPAPGDLNGGPGLSTRPVEELIEEGRAGSGSCPLEALLPGIPKVISDGGGRRPASSERAAAGARRCPGRSRRPSRRRPGGTDPA